MRIRKYTASDDKEVSDLIVRNLLEVNAKDYSYSLMAELAACYTPETVTSGAAEKDVYVAIQGEKIVATAALLEDGRIHDVFVDSRRHGQGIGRAIMTHLESLAKERGIRVIALPSSITAIGFYERLGYTRLKEITSAEGLAEVLMKKEL